MAVAVAAVAADREFALKQIAVNSEANLDGMEVCPFVAASVGKPDRPVHAHFPKMCGQILDLQDLFVVVMVLVP